MDQIMYSISIVFSIAIDVTKVAVDDVKTNTVGVWLQ